MKTNVSLYNFPSILLNLTSNFLQLKFSLFTGTSRLCFNTLFRNYQGLHNPVFKTGKCNLTDVPGNAHHLHQEKDNLSY